MAPGFRTIECLQKPTFYGFKARFVSVADGRIRDRPASSFEYWEASAVYIGGTVIG